ncbi:MAG: hydroxyacid dehydrogenase [Rhodospirillales bacterium]|nr:hydroxyacid dehydrogenase [Rhodospirillales bacterium]MBO6786161.1 hydroxyacid dehydrogenase [Rhodospirillales bacterium]
MKRVLVTEDMHPRGYEVLEAAPDIEVIRIKDIEPATLKDAVRDVDGILVRSAKLTADILEAAENLKVVARHGVGCDSIDVAHLSARGIPVAIAAGANSRSVAEHTLGLMLAAARELPLLDNVVKSGRWADRNNYRAKDLMGAKVLIVGFGRIGRLVAPLCKAFGMETVVADIVLDETLASEMGCRGVEDFRPELADADFVTLHVPLDETTRHLVGEAELAAMKSGSILINCARGGIVDDNALLAALVRGHIRGAGLDVMADEPPAADHPLIGRTDVVMTPHNGAGAMSAAIAMAEMSAVNIIDAFAGNLREDCTFNLDALRANDMEKKSA